MTNRLWSIGTLKMNYTAWRWSVFNLIEIPSRFGGTTFGYWTVVARGKLIVKCWTGVSLGLIASV